MKKEREYEKNRKQEEEIRAFLRSTAQPEIDWERKRQALEFLRMERRRLRIPSKKPYGQRVLEQMAYLSPAVWLIQGALVLILGWTFCVGDRKGILINLLFCAPIVGIVGFTEIMRSYRQNMWELDSGGMRCGGYGIGGRNRDMGALNVLFYPSAPFGLCISVSDDPFSAALSGNHPPGSGGMHEPLVVYFDGGYPI